MRPTAYLTRSTLLGSLFFLALLFLWPKAAFGQVTELQCSPGVAPREVSKSFCEAANVPLENVCFQNPWQFKYAAACVAAWSGTGASCNFSYRYEYNTCSTADRCFGSNVGATGFDSAGRVLPGICDASKYNGTDPNTACVSGSQYKQCCEADGTGPATACSNGTCPNGSITAAGTTTCAAERQTLTLNGTVSADSACPARTVSLSWNALTGESQYIVWRWDGSAWTNLGSTTGTGFTDSTVAQGATYTYQIHAVATNTNSNGKQVTVPVCPSTAPTSTPTGLSCAPSSPSVAVNTNVTFTASGGSTGNYTWSAPGGDPIGANNVTSSTFTTKYSTTGTKTVNVTRGGSSPASCSVNVTSGPYVTPPGGGTGGTPTPAPQPGGPTVDLKANNSDGPITVISGASVNLAHTTTNSPDSCTGVSSPADSRWDGVKNRLGGGITFGVTTSTTFSITCSKAGFNPVSDSVTVNVGSQPPAYTYPTPQAEGPPRIISGTKIHLPSREPFVTPKYPGGYITAGPDKLSAALSTNFISTPAQEGFQTGYYGGVAYWFLVHPVTPYKIYACVYDQRNTGCGETAEPGYGLYIGVPAPLDPLNPDEVRIEIFYELTDLDLEIVPKAGNKTRYKPGETASMTFTVTNHDFENVQGVTVGFWPTGAVGNNNLPSCPQLRGNPLDIKGIDLLPGTSNPFNSQDLTFTFPVGTTGATAYAYVTYGCGLQENTWTNNLASQTYIVAIDSWFETVSGDVGSHAAVSVSQVPPAAKYQSSFLLAGKTLDANVRVGPSGFRINNYSGKLVSVGVYDYLSERFRQQAIDGGNAGCEIPAGQRDGLWYCSGDAVFNSGEGPKGNSVWFIDGNLVIKKDLKLTGAADTVTFVVKGTITVETGVKRIDGIYIAGNSFVDYDTVAGTAGEQLLVNGAVYAEAVNLGRVLGGANCSSGPACDNAQTAADKFVFDPKYLVGLNGILGSPDFAWREVNP